MDLDALLRNRLKKLSASPERRRERKKPSPNQKHKQNMRYIIKLIETGDYDSTKRSHRILLHTAHKNGYIDKDTLEILKQA